MGMSRPCRPSRPSTLTIAVATPANADACLPLVLGPRFGARLPLASRPLVRPTVSMPPPDSPSSNPFVFHDPSGLRARRAGYVGGLLLSLLGAIVAVFLATLALAPRLPTLTLQDPEVLQGLHQENAKRLKGKPPWSH